MFQSCHSRLFGLLIIGLIFLAAGCASSSQTPEDVTPEQITSPIEKPAPALRCPADELAEKFARLEPGASRAEVKACLGQPAAVNEYKLPTIPFFGPSESLASILEPETPIEEWIYHDDENSFYLWFASSTGEPKEQWRLIEKAMYPKGAVFEAQ
jgi:hypothetical protein